MSSEILPATGALSPERLAFRSSWKQTVLDLAILIVSAILLACAYPGVNLAFLAWFALVPMIALTVGKSPLRACIYGFVWGYVWNLCVCFWLREIAFGIPFAFAAVLGAFPALWTLVIPFFYRNILYPKELRLKGSEALRAFYEFNPLSELLFAVTMACWWIALEWVRSWIFTGFPWNLLATTQWQNAHMIQLCEFTGIYGVGFLLIFMNLAIFLAGHGFRRSIPDGKYKRSYPLLLAGLLIILNSWLGVRTYEWRRSEYQSGNILNFPVGVVQPDLSQRRDPVPGQNEEALETCLKLSRDLIRRNQETMNRSIGMFVQKKTDTSEPSSALPEVGSREYLQALAPLSLIVWPETAVPTPYRGGSEFASVYRRDLKRLVDESKIPFLVGSIDFGEVRSNSDFDIYNSALLIEPDREIEFGIRDRYSKIHIVPFGEFVPLGNLFPVLNKWIGMGRNLTPGTRFNPIEVAPGVRAGISICYEDVFPYISRSHTLAGANMLLVITNDAWYPTSFEPEQHYANSIFRAVETRLPMLRCGNSNYSVLIDPMGRLVDSVYKRYDDVSGEYQYFPGMKGAAAEKIIVPVPRNHRMTFYTRYGNVFVLGCWIVFLFGTLWTLFRWRTYHAALAAPFEDAH